MTLSILQSISCLSLAAMALRFACLKPNINQHCNQLWPYILFAGVMGILLVVPYFVEVFVALYFGSIYEVEAAQYRLTGPYWWVYGNGIVLPQLPWLGLIPWIGKKPFLVVTLAVLGVIPVIFAFIF